MESTTRHATANFKAKLKDELLFQNSNARCVMLKGVYLGLDKMQFLCMHTNTRITLEMAQLSLARAPSLQHVEDQHTMQNVMPCDINLCYTWAMIFFNMQTGTLQGSCIRH